MDALHHIWHFFFFLVFLIMQEYARNLRAIGIDAREIETFRALWQCVAPRDKQDNIQFWCKDQFEYIEENCLRSSISVDTSRVVRLGWMLEWFLYIELWILIAATVSFWTVSSGLYKGQGYIQNLRSVSNLMLLETHRFCWKIVLVSWYLTFFLFTHIWREHLFLYFSY